jgi:hypothetical protein
MVHVLTSKDTLMTNRLLLAQGRRLANWSAVLLLATSCLGGGASRAEETPHTAGWVVIGLDEYKTLRAKAYPPERQPEPPPVEATLSRVDYDLRVRGDFASGRATLTIDVLKDGWVRVPIPAGLLVRDAKLEGKLVSLVNDGSGKGGHLSAVLSHTGRFALLLDITLPIATSAGEESISLPASLSGVTRATVEVPRQGMDIKLAGGLLSERSESATGSRSVVYATGNAPLSFSWRRKTEDHRAELPLRLRGGLTEIVALGEDSTSLSAEVNVEVAQGLAREVKLEIPPQVTVNQVFGASVSDWESKAGELTVTFLEPVEQSARFVIAAEARLPRDGRIEAPLLKLRNAERLTGGVAVEVLGAGEIKEVKTQGLENADASDLGEIVASRQSPSLVAFRLRAGDANQPRSLNVSVARYDQQAVLLANVEEARYRVLLSKEGKTLVEARYAVRNNQRNFVKITLPSGAALWSATLSGRPVRPGQTKDGSLLLPLEKSRASEDAPEFAVEIVYLAPGANWADKGKARIALPALDLPVSRTGLQIYYPPLFRVTAEPGLFRTENYAGPSSPVLGANGEEFAAGFGSAGVESGVVVRSGPDLDRFARIERKSDAAAALAPGVPFPPPPPPAGPKDLSLSGRGLPAAQAASPDATRTLVDKYRSSTSVGRAAGILPIYVNFPAFGPSVYLVSELTGENQSPSAELSYQPDKKGGAR